MKIGRFVYAKKVHYGLIENDSVRVIEGDILGDFTLGKDLFPCSKVQWLAPINPPNVVAIGMNYRKHSLELHDSLPEKPVIFLKATSSVIGPHDPIVLPHMAPNCVDYEGELAVIIGKKAKNVGEDKALDYVFGYTCANDVTARDCQIHLDVQWARGKSFDTFCPLGPWVETELDLSKRAVRTYLNGRVVQDSDTSDMIFQIPYLISYCSCNMTLLPGTVILTGTPAGVGQGRKPPLYLSSGDVVEVEIDGIGTLTNPVKRETGFTT